jgi:hypothetical protein
MYQNVLTINLPRGIYNTEGEEVMNICNFNRYCKLPFETVIPMYSPSNSIVKALLSTLDIIRLINFFNLMVFTCFFFIVSEAKDLFTC